jgi:hypothetical protein
MTGDVKRNVTENRNSGIRIESVKNSSGSAPSQV